MGVAGFWVVVYAGMHGGYEDVMGGGGGFGAEVNRWVLSLVRVFCGLLGRSWN